MSVRGKKSQKVAKSWGGPRHDPSVTADSIDEYQNRILLCRVHHKVIDDQAETYTADRLLQLKERHETWVADQLNQDREPNPVRIRRVHGKIPTHLVRVTSGRALLNIVMDAEAYSFDSDEPRSKEEADEIAGFLQVVQDWGEVGLTEAGEIVSAAFSLTESIQGMESLGFWVFGAREQQALEGGSGSPSKWTIAILQVIRKDSDQIIVVGDAQQADATDRPSGDR